MSTTIDQKVVEMRFDNQHFEKNVSTTMSTLDKLKSKLKFGDSSKGLDEINKAVRNVDMKGLGAGVEAVHAKFSALQVMGVTALANITNSAVNAGKRMVSALTIDPIKTGFQEYETQINAVQTILANTSSKGTDINQVNKALEELNKYADMTIYNFTEMTRNIGTFTAAGVDLDTSVSAIKGIANLAAVSGSTSQQASTAMYQLSQALATGTVKLQDWNSVVNAGMGGEVFQNALKRTAQVMGTDVDALIKKYGSFRESLTRGEWLTTEILTKTLNQFTMAAEEGSATWEKYKKSLMDEGYTAEQATEILKMANTATDAATKVKTFTQLWDVLKESAQSGWSQSWKIIIGDFEEAKSLLTPLADVLTGFINKFSEARNTLLESALGKGFKGLSKRMNSFLTTVNNTTDSVKGIVDTISDYSQVVDDIMGGKWGTGQERWDALAKAGYDWAHAQNLVNEKLGDGTRHATNYSEAQKNVKTSQDAVNKSTGEHIKRLALMTEAELKAAGYTDLQIKTLKELCEAADKTGIPLEEFVENIDQIDGRYLLINAFKNAASGLVGIFKAIGEAWRDAFDPISASQVFNLIAGFHKFTMSLRLTDKETGKLNETGQKLARTFKGIFAVLDIVTTIFGSGLKLAFDVISQVLSYFNLDILDVTAGIGDAVVKFRDWFESIFDISKVLDVVVPILKTAAEYTWGWISSLSNIPMISNFITGIKSAFSMLKETDWASIGKDILAGFSNGLWSGVKNAFDIIVNFGKELLSRFCTVVGVQSPSWKMFEIAQDFLRGFLNGLGALAGTVWDFITEFGKKCVDILGNIDWGAVFAVGITVAMLYTVKKLTDVISAFSAPFEGLGAILDEVSGVVASFGKVTKAIAFDIRTKAIKNLAISLGILVAAIIALTFIDPKELWNAVAIIVVLSGVLVALAWASSKMSDASAEIGKNGVSIEGLKSGLISIGIALLLLAATVKLIGGMDTDDAIRGFVGLVGVMAAMVGFLWACQAVTKNGISDNITKVASLMIRLSIALMLMVAVIKMVDKLEPEQLQKGAVFAVAFTLFVAALGTIAKDTQTHTAKFGGMMIKLAIAMMLMVGVLKLVDSLTPAEALKGVAFVAAFTLFIKALVKVTQIGKETQIAKLGGLLMAVSFSMMMMVASIKLIDMLTVGEMLKGVAFVGAFILFIKALISVTTIGSDQQLAKVGLTVLGMAVAIGVLAGVTAMLSLISTKGLVKGLIAIGLLTTMMANMIKATQGANDIKASLIVMAVVIGLMAAAVAGLSLIDTSKLAGATLAMSMLMATFGLMAKMSSTVQGSIGSLIVMTVAVTMMAGILWLLSTLNVQTSITNAAGLSLLLVAVSASMFILSKMSMTIKEALKGVLMLSAMTVPMLAFIGVLAVMNLVENATTNAKTLTGLMVTMTAVLGALTIIGAFWVGAAAGIIALTALAIPMLSFVGILALMNKIQNATANAELLTGLMTTMTKILTVLAIVGPLALIGVVAMQGLVILMGEIAVMAAVIGGLVTTFPALQTFINTGLPLLEQLAGSLGTMIGNFVSGFATSVSGALPQIGTDLSTFMTNAKPFIEGAKLIDETVVTGVKCLSGALIALTTAELINGIASFISGGVSLGDLGSDLSTFIENAKPFIDNVKLIDPTVTEGAKALAETILILTGANLIEGIASFLVGESSLGTFGAELGSLGTHLNAFATNLGTFDETKASSVTMAANAIKALAEAASTLPNDGGWAGKIFGENSISDFGHKLPQLGINIAAFASNLGTFSDDQVNTVSCAANAIKSIAEAADKIPNEGGWAAKIFGENSIATFASQLPGLGTNLASFAANLGTFGEDKVATIKCAGNAIVAMADAASNIDGQSEWAKKIFGDNSLSSFSGQFGTLGTNLAAFATNLGTFDDSKVATVNAAVKAISAFSGLADADLEGAKKNIDGFGSKLGSFGENVAAMCSSLPSAETLTLAKTAVNQVLSLINDIAAADAEGTERFVNSLKKIATDAVSSFVKTFTSVDTGTKVKTAGSTMMTKLIEGMKSKISDLKKTMEDAAEDAADAAEDAYSDFKSAGKYLVEGFAAGISESTFEAEAKAAAMAKAALAAAEEALGIASPSKEFYKVGRFAGMGLVNALRDYGEKSYKAGVEVAESAKSGLKDAMRTIADTVSTDIDSQPTIRPVLDLSDIQSGAGRINSLFGTNPSVGLMANVGSISSMMSNNQNGGNGDIISAIKDLRDSLGNGRGDTYTINGVTYDDGSNIKDAVSSIVRAAKMERRT